MYMNILLTGQPHVGKSTLIRGLVADISYKQGFLTQEIIDGGLRTGYELISALGDTATLASVHSTSSIRVSRYGVDVEALDAFVAKLPAAEPGNLLYIDEIGQMELFSADFKDLARKYLDAPEPFIGTLKKDYHDDFTDALRARNDIEIIEVKPQNRDTLGPELASRIATQLS